ncbi:uncharacterized protein LOC110892991 [Helianthus annuus]|uniref:uncharacterized protein LOC110892991 n=1 Tax=Helianthus annuus TaxID=4232 RepID=UPI000B908709|nr:uncharacterized protein LOC110892991 [Helianthus annuus]
MWDHIDGTPTPDKEAVDYSSWKKIDAVVLQWIYGTLSSDLLVHVLEDKSTAFEAWKRFENLFLNNKGSRASALQHGLTNLTLSAMPDLDSYCQRICDLMDQLAVVDNPPTPKEFSTQFAAYRVKTTLPPPASPSVFPNRRLLLTNSRPRRVGLWLMKTSHHRL